MWASPSVDVARVPGLNFSRGSWAVGLSSPCSRPGHGTWIELERGGGSATNGGSVGVGGLAEAEAQKRSGW